MQRQRSLRPASQTAWPGAQPPRPLRCCCGEQRLGRSTHGRPVAMARAVPEQTQEQQQQQQPAAAPGPSLEPDSSPHRQFVSSEAITTMQEEQEAQLKMMVSDLPVRELRFEWLAVWVAAAAAFGAGIWYTQGAEKGQEFFAGYLLEQSLSIDNLFVFVLVFSYFKTPLACQPKVLNYGIATAAVLRAVMILLGTELIQSFRPLLLGFAGVLLWSAYGLLAGGDDDDDEDLSDNAIVKLCRRLLPVGDAYVGDRFFAPAPAALSASSSSSSSNGSGSSESSSGSGSASSSASGGGGESVAMLATPLLLTLAVVELSDVVFAVDSIPAVFGVTLDPFIVYSSNMFAILSLRSLYAFVSTVMTELRFLDKSVAVVLAFIGVKMTAEFAGADIPTNVSLLVVGLVLGAGVGASVAFPEAPDSDSDGEGGGDRQGR